MDRRRFLGVTGAGVVTALTGCGGGGGGSTPSTASAPASTSVAAAASGDTATPPATTGGTTQPNNTVSPPTEADWRALAAGMQGTLVMPDSAGYEQARVPFNSRFDAVRAQAVARCANPDDVSEVLAFVKRFGLPVAPRGGGHSYGGYSTGTGVVIDVGPMNAISAGSGSATVGAGARLVDVYDQLTAQGVCIPSGTCPSVGIAGITQGGGIGIVDRSFGLTCDRLLSAQIVTADGRQLTVDANREPDLFWALRGGGGGNFGVVTSFTFQTHQTGDMTEFLASYRFVDAARVLTAWQNWSQTLPDRIWATLAFVFDDQPGNDITFYVAGVCVGGLSNLEPYWSNFLNSVGLQPENSMVQTRTYRAQALGDCGGLSVSQCHLPGQTADAAMKREAMAGSSDYFNALIPADGIQAMLQAIRNRHAAGKSGCVLFHLLGGAGGRVASSATAYVHRSALFNVQYYAYYPLGTAAGMLDDAAGWANGMRGVMQAWSTGGAYQNYIDPLITNWKPAYYGANYARLASVKGRYDPTAVFRFAQGITAA
jgi:FAD/FMN-containing dehydrogenase